MNPQCNMRNAVLSIIVFVCGFGAGFLLRPVVLPSRDGGSSVITRTDTLTLRDTVIERMTEYIDRTVLDTVLVTVSDTVMSRDTVYIRATAVQKHYKGEDYDAWVSGWELSGRGPMLDSIYVYPQTRYVTSKNIFVEPRNCNELALESSAFWCNAASLTLSLKYTHEWGRWYLSGSAGYDVIAGSPYVGVTAGVPIFRW